MALSVQLQIHRSVRFGRYLEFAALTLVARTVRQGMPKGQARETGVKRTRQEDTQEDTQEEDSNRNMKTRKQKKQIDNTETQKLRQTAHRDNTTTTDNTTHTDNTQCKGTTDEKKQDNRKQTKPTQQTKSTTQQTKSTAQETKSTTER